MKLKILCAVLMLAVMPALAHAQMTDSVVAARTHNVAAQLRCPVCQGLSLADSQSELSLQMRGVITDQIRAGKSDDEVIEYFVAKYGEWILLEPKARGFNLIAYFLPIIVLAAGIVVIYASVRKWTRPQPDQPTVLNMSAETPIKARMKNAINR